MYIGKYCFVHSACPLFVIRRLSAIREWKVCWVYRNSSLYIHGGPLYRGGLLLGGSVIEGSTVLYCVLSPILILFAYNNPSMC